MTSRAADSLPRPGARASRRRPGERATVLAVTLITIAILSVIAANLVFSASSRYHVTYQSASWQEALVAAESGVDLAMNELRRRVINGPGDSFLPTQNWNTQDASGRTFPESGRAFPADGQPFLVSRHDGEGNSLMSARVYVDVPGSDQTPLADNSFAQQPPSQQSGANFNQSFLAQPDDANKRDADGVDRSRWWYRIRALGIAGVSGPTRTNVDTRDNRLRKFSFFTDWRTSQPVASPQVSRLVEVVARPLTNFRNALMADVQIDLSSKDVLIDSYDSSKGLYNATTNTGTMGNLATNGKLINAGSATVMGDAMTNDGAVEGGEKVTGQQRSDYYQELPPVQALGDAWANVTTQLTVTTDAIYTASPDPGQPTRVRLNGINLPTGGRKITLAGPPRGLGGAPANAPSYIKVLVEGDIATLGDSAIEIADGVNAIFYVGGNINLQGYGILNDSFIPGRLLINGLRPPENADGSLPARTINIATMQDFEGIIYAPSHDLSFALNVVNDSGDGVATSLANQIANLQKQAAEYQNKAAKYTTEAAQKMAEYQLKGDPKKLQEANNLTAQATQATNSANALLQQITQLQGNAAQQDDRNRGYNGIYGGFIGKTIAVKSKTHVHYDEVLRNAGPVNHYEIVNWFEDIYRRGAPDSPQPLWWVTAAR